MPITYHKATAADIHSLVENRILFATELSNANAEHLIPTLRTQLTAYFTKTTEENTCISFLASCDNEVVGIGSLHIREMPGNFINPSGRWGYVMNMYTAPAYRRQGICKNILRLLVEAGKNSHVMAFELHATKEGELVYIQEGFVHHNEPTLRRIIQ